MAERGSDDNNLRGLQTTRKSWAEVGDTEEPSLAREIGKVAWLSAKVTGVILAVVSMLYPIFSWSPVAGICTFYVMIFAAMIVQAGYWNYKSKKSDLKWKQQRREDTARWDEASKRLHGDKTE